MKKKKPTYKELHGTTRVGDFLRSINKSDLFKTILTASGEFLTGDIGGVIDALTTSKELTAEQKDYALKLAEMDLKELTEITTRWNSDMTSDSWLSKNTRPLTLIYLTLMLTLFVILDSANIAFNVDVVWIDLLKTLLMTVFVAYFGSRGLEKFKKITNS